jgi:type VI secretion system protein ImpG
LQILAMKMRPTLGKQEIISMFHYMGTLREGPYKGIPKRLRSVDIELRPASALHDAGIKHVYSVDVEAYPPEDEALMWSFLCQMMRLLDCWNQDATVELKLNTAGSPMSLPILF